MLGESPDMHFVDDRLVERATQLCVTFPIIVGDIGDDALHCMGRVVTCSSARLAVEGLGDCNRSPIGIQQDLFTIETHAVFGQKRPLGTIGIDLPR